MPLLAHTRINKDEQHSYKLRNSRSDDYPGGAYLGLWRVGSLYFKPRGSNRRSGPISRDRSGALANVSREFLDAKP